MACTENNPVLIKTIYDSVKVGLTEMVPEFGSNNLPVEYRLAGTLGQSAGKLFLNNIIHGQFNIHYQNVSLLGELADFDSSVFLGMYSPEGDDLTLRPIPEIKASYDYFQNAISF